MPRKHRFATYPTAKLVETHDVYMYGTGVACTLSEACATVTRCTPVDAARLAFRQIYRGLLHFVLRNCCRSSCLRVL